MSEKSLPKPNAEVAYGQPDQWTPELVRGMVTNPIYAGFGPFPALVSDEQWIRAAAKAIQEDGSEQFLVNLLYLLRTSFAESES